MKILFTGFDPFGGEKVNPSYEAVRALPEEIEGYKVLKLEVPTVFHKGPAKVRAFIEKEKPDMVICVGQAGGRSAITPEKIAINCIRGDMADNEGNLFYDEKVSPEGDIAYYSTLPCREIVEALNEAGIKGEISYSAGAYVCNSLMYEVLRCQAAKDSGIKAAGFIHVPYIPEQVAGKPEGTAAMELKTITEGLIIAAKTTISRLK